MDYLYVHELSTEFHPQWSHIESKWYIVISLGQVQSLQKATKYENVNFIKAYSTGLDEQTFSV